MQSIVELLHNHSGVAFAGGHGGEHRERSERAVREHAGVGELVGMLFTHSEDHVAKLGGDEIEPAVRLVGDLPDVTE